MQCATKLTFMTFKAQIDLSLVGHSYPASLDNKADARPFVSNSNDLKLDLSVWNLLTNMTLRQFFEIVLP